MTIDKTNPVNHHRRLWLQRGLVASGVMAIGPGLWGCTNRGSPRAANALGGETKVSNVPNLSGTLREVKVENDPHTRMLIPQGFKVREVARSGGKASGGSDYVWHSLPDGGATFATGDGGWIYVSNSELGAQRGGVGALRFDAAGEVRDSYSICSGTSRNCAGGPTPWGTWLTCEETDDGLVHECDPLGEAPAVAAPALGRFKHEAAAVDPSGRHIYLTEDTPDGNFYRFAPEHYPAKGRADLREGRLQVAVVEGQDVHQSRPVRWVDLPHPLTERNAETPTATRHQIPEAEKFNGGEGCWYHQGLVYFTTKGDNRVWAFDTQSSLLDLVYDKHSDQAFNPGIGDVDNLTVSSGGDILVAEDGAQMRLVVVGPGVKPFELVSIIGHGNSEIAGPAFSPDGSRLYFSSQRGPSGKSSDGRTYELRGPFFV